MGLLNAFFSIEQYAPKADKAPRLLNKTSLNLLIRASAIALVF